MLISSAAAASDRSQTPPPATTTTIAAHVTTTSTEPTTTTTAALAPPASAPTARDRQEMFDEAMNRLPAGVWDYLAARGWRISVQGGIRGFVGRTWRYDKAVVIYVRPSMDFDAVLGSVAHEVGHAVDFECFDDADRAAILITRGRSTSSWFPTTINGGDDRNWGVGDWAETFALTVTGAWDGKWPNPGLSQARELVADFHC